LCSRAKIQRKRRSFTVPITRANSLKVNRWSKTNFNGYPIPEANPGICATQSAGSRQTSAEKFSGKTRSLGREGDRV